MYRAAEVGRFNTQFISRYGGVVCLLSALLLAVLFFFSFGWERLWASQTFRFEASAGGLSIISVRALSVLLLLCGIFSVLCVMSGAITLGIGAWLLCVLPFMVSASRGFSVLVASLMIAVVLRSSGIKRHALIFVAIVVVAFALLVPLEMRRYNNTGIYYFLTAGAGLFDSGASLETSLAMLFQNLGVGFPIFVEAVSQGETGVPIWSGVPLQYKILSFSPTPSFIDGFNSRWLIYTPFINIYTPYNAFAELHALGTWCLFLVLGLHSLFAFLIAALWRRRGLSGPIWTVCLCLLVAFTLIQASQYPLRTFVKNTTVLFLMGCLLSFALAFAKGNTRGFKTPKKA